MSRPYSGKAPTPDTLPERHLRPMTADDLPVVERMFFDIFRPGAKGRGDFSRYFERLFLEGPHAGGGLVSTLESGETAAVIAFIPIPFRAGERRITGRMACAFMCDSRHPKAAARIVMALRARGQDFLFSDSASPTSAGHWKASGGATLAVQSLEWRCRFRPLSATAQQARLPALLDPLFAAGDRLVTRLRSPRGRVRTAAPSGLAAKALDTREFAALLPEMLAQFSVRPDWSEDELHWLLSLAGENRALGPLRFFALTRPDGTVAGCYAAYFGRRGRARVLDVLAQPGAEAQVVATMAAHLEAQGIVEAVGAGQPHLLTALSPLRGMSFRHRAFTCIATRHADIREAIARNDIYVGGLAGESWSRLMTDFY